MIEHDVHARVLEFIAAEPPAKSDGGDEGFARLALDVFAHQFSCIASYRRVCEGQGKNPSNVECWRDIPPVPALAFKHLDLCCDEPQRVFLSTGTTQGAERRSRHCMPDLRLYRASAVAGLRRFLFPDLSTMRLLSLIPTAVDRPESSLSQMADWALESFGAPTSVVFATPDRLDFAAFTESLRASEQDGQPVCILTTTAALIHFFDYCRDHDSTFRLSHSSRLMDTGGDKGAPRVLSRKGLLQAVWNTFAIPGYFVVNEYGMSELSSQYYDNVVRNRCLGQFRERAKVGPPWLRTRVVDPITLEDVGDGEIGLLCHVDLANAGSALAVLTEDLGRVTDAGLEVLGRVQGAEARGCSLALAEFQRQSGRE